MRASIADFEVMEQLGGPAGDPPRYLCRPPARLEPGDPVEVAEVAVGEGGWARWSDLLTRMAAVADPALRIILECGPDPEGSGAYLASEAAAGGSLAAPAGPAEPGHPARIEAVAAAARAAHALHEAGLAHGSIDPAALLLTERGPVLATPRVDRPEGFVAPATDGRRLAAVDPDLLRGEAPSRATDVWSLGATLHLALSGRELYRGIGSDQPVTAVQRVMFTRPEIDPALPAGLAALIARCLHPDPAERPATAAEVADALTGDGGA